MNKFTNKDFVHLHTHSDSSNFDGLVKINELTLQARKMGFPAIALTDHGNMGNIIKLIKGCYATKDKKGNKIEYPPIKPIIGVEAYLSRYLHGDKDNQPDRKKGNRHLILLAKNREGYKNLCRLQTVAWREGVYYGSPRIDIDLLAKHHEGLMCGSACLSGLVHANLIKGKYEEAKKVAGIFKDIFGEDFYLEVQYHGIADEAINVPSTIKLGKELNIPVTCTNDIHFLRKDQALSQEVLMCMSTHNCLNNPKHLSHPYPEFYLKSAKEMAEIFGEFPETLYNTVAIAERVDDKDIKRYLFDEGVRLPKIDLPEGYETSFDYLVSLAKEGMKRRGWDKSKKHIERLKTELTDVKVALDVNELDFPTYFLIVRDYVNWAKEKEIMVGSGRGSGYSSILLHCLGICSGLDPLDEDLGLLWERFLGFDFCKYFIYKDLGLKKKENFICFSVNKDKIKKEILSVIDKDNHNIYVKNVVKKELEEFENTNGIKGKNNLESFYDIWKNYENDIGDKNEINSWTVYYLNMTQKKPDKQELFQIPIRRIFARAGLPDIDLDFCYLRRDEVINYTIKKYGDNFAGAIGTYGTMKFRTAVARVVKALDIANAYHKGPSEYTTENMAKVNEILASIPKAKGILQAKDIATGEKIKVKSVNDAMRCFKEFNWYMTQKYPEVKKHVDNMEGLIQSFTVHPAGVIVSSVPLDELVPQRKSRDKGMATQYSHEELEDIGIIKFDDLGLSTLTTIDKTFKLIKENYDIEFDRDLTCFSSVDDKATFETYRSGDLIGVFQCEEYGMQETIKKIAPTGFNDIMAAIALYRPGPLQFIPQYCDCKNGLRNVDYFHPSIKKHVKKLLDKTYGIMIYQESIMQVCNILAGFSITDGYVMIKAIGKKKLDLMKQFETQFIDGCEKNGVPRDVAQAYWEKYIIPFAGYGFNKCLSGDMRVEDINTGKFYNIEDLSNTNVKDANIELLSFVNNKLEKDKLIDVFETGEKEIYEVELDNGMIIKCTLDHKFYCSDNKEYTLREIIDKDLDILYQ